MALKQLLASRASIFFLAAAAGGLLGASPAARRRLRALVKKAIKSGLLLKEEMQAMADRTREDWQDLVAEAQAELDEERDTPAKPAHDHNHPH